MKTLLLSSCTQTFFLFVYKNAIFYIVKKKCNPQFNIVFYKGISYMQNCLLKVPNGQDHLRI